MKNIPSICTFLPSTVISTSAGRRMVWEKLRAALKVAARCEGRNERTTCCRIIVPGVWADQREDKGQRTVRRWLEL